MGNSNSNFTNIPDSRMKFSETSSNIQSDLSPSRAHHSFGNNANFCKNVTGGFVLGSIGQRKRITQQSENSINYNCFIYK
ncbi:unnamed protein product [Gordionus sp. m RMFG-2023]